MEAYFIYNNLKAHPFKINTEPAIPGFRVLSWDSWTYGTLWDIGKDAAYTRIGTGKVFGQLWIPEDYKNLSLLEGFCGIDTGLTEEVKVKVEFPIGIDIEEISAVTYSLAKIQSEYKIIHDGKWRF